MAKRRLLRGKKLLVAAGITAATSFVGCDDDAVANLVAPPDSGEMDANMPDDGSVMMPDAVVANLVAPPDSGLDGGGTDGGDADAGGTDAGGTDAGDPDDAGSDAMVGPPDAAVANLLPPPDGSF